MLQLRLPALDSQAAPPWPDLAACEFWLSQLQVTDIRSAQEDIRSRLDLLNRCVVPAARRLETIEALRETVAFVQSEYRKRLIGRPLPFNESENAIFAGLMLLWESMAAGYQRCLQACIEGDAAIASGKALICQRLLRYAGVQILEHVLACLEVPPESWQELHRLYRYAEAEQVAAAGVEDPLSDHNPSSCKNIYVQVLLAHLANPYELAADLRLPLADTERFRNGAALPPQRRSPPLAWISRLTTAQSAERWPGATVRPGRVPDEQGSADQNCDAAARPKAPGSGPWQRLPAASLRAASRSPAPQLVRGPDAAVFGARRRQPPGPGLLRAGRHPLFCLGQGVLPAKEKDEGIIRTAAQGNRGLRPRGFAHRKGFNAATQF